MVEQSNDARVHRFHDFVAFRVGESETLYVSATLAEQLAGQLATFAADIREQPTFHKSTLRTVELHGEVAG